IFLVLHDYDESLHEKNSSGDGMLAILGCATGQRVSSHLPSRHACGVSVTKTLALTALPASPVSITGPTSVCPNQAGLMYTTPAVTGVTQQWALPTGGVITAGQGTTSMTGTWGTVAGMVTVRGINACGQSGTRGLSVSLLTCMDGDHSDDGLSRSLFMNAYPNPNDGSFVVRASEPGRLIVLDELGRVMTEVSLSSALGLQHTFTDLSAGVYFVKFVATTASLTERVVVIK
ncbi:MAG: T9SS type A sorting domain-containing protein, partial [Flavobacteriales bacterium]